MAENYAYDEQAEATLAPPKQGEVHVALNGLMQRIKKTRAQLDHLGQRLAPVLQDATKDERPMESSISEVFSSQLAREIRDASEEVASMERRIAELMERLQV